MSKERVDSDKVANELMGGASAFFRPSAKPAATQPDPSPAESQDATPQVTPVRAPAPDVMTSRRQSVTTSKSDSSREGFDINRPTASRDSLRLAVDETKALDQLRADLKWDYDLTVSKNDICRVALHWLLEEYAAKGEKSAAVSRLKRKQSGR